MAGDVRWFKVPRRWLLCGAVAGCAGLVGCVAPGTAPVVSRTGPKAAPTAPARPPAAENVVVQTTPVRSGAADARGIEVRSLESAPVSSGSAAPAAVPPSSAGPQGRATPRGTKVAYSDALWNEMKAADQAALSAPAAASKTKATEPRPAPQAESEAKAKAAVKPEDKPEARAESKPPEEGKAEPKVEAKPEAAREVEAKTEGGTESSRDWGWPSPGKVLQTFDGSAHKGLLIAGKAGDSVLAAADGQVIFSGNGPRGYGNLVIVKHPKDLVSVYAQNRSLVVKEGQQVKRGQKLAELGEPAQSSPRLHFEIRQRGKPVDPARFLPRR